MIKKLTTLILSIMLLLPSIVGAEFYLGPAKIGTGPIAILTQIEYDGFMTGPWNSGHAFYAAQQIAQNGYKTVVLLAANYENCQAAHYGNGRLWPIKSRGIIKKTPFHIIAVGRKDYVFTKPTTTWNFDPESAIVIPVSADMTKQSFLKKVKNITNF